MVDRLPQPDAEKDGSCTGIETDRRADEALAGVCARALAGRFTLIVLFELLLPLFVPLSPLPPSPLHVPPLQIYVAPACARVGSANWAMTVTASSNGSDCLKFIDLVSSVMIAAEQLRDCSTARADNGCRKTLDVRIHCDAGAVANITSRDKRHSLFRSGQLLQNRVF